MHYVLARLYCVLSARPSWIGHAQLSFLRQPSHFEWRKQRFYYTTSSNVRLHAEHMALMVQTPARWCQSATVPDLQATPIPTSDHIKSHHSQASSVQLQPRERT
jgi:hypothetical protein